MWRPLSAAQLITAIDGGTLPQESASYEYKERLPDRNKNSDIAIDVAAMATDGGIIIYGVREDKERLLFAANPIPLEGVNERISEIVSSNVREDVQITVQLHPLEEDSTMGFVVVEVPPSLRAPHMVE